MSQAQSARREWLGRCGLALAAGALTLISIELMLRMFAPLHLVGIQRAYEYDAELGFRVRAGIHRLETTDHQQEIRTNRLGTVNFQEHFANYTVKVFAIGDSYTQGTGLPADAAYPFQLDLLLNMTADGAYRRSYGIINLGLAAYGGEQSLLTLQRYAASLGKPDIVLYLGAENDADDDAMFLAGDRHRHLVAGNPRYGSMLPLLQWAAATEIGKRAKLARQSLLAQGGAGERGTENESSVAEQQKSVLERLARASRALDAKLIVSWSHAPSPSYEWLKGWAKANDVAFSDWLPAALAIRAAMPDIPWHNQHSGGHLRGWINHVIASTFAREVAAFGVTIPARR